MILGVDFDRVLFDTDSFNEYLKEEVEGLRHVDTSPYNEHGAYSPRIHAELCGIPVERIYEAMEDLERFLYGDINELENTNHELILVTRGEKEFQKKKVNGCGIEDIFDNVIVIEEGSKDVAEIDFLIDDQKKEIEEADLPGFEFDRNRHSLSDALEEAEKHAA